MSPTLSLIRTLLSNIITDIDTGACDISNEKQSILVNLLLDKDISKHDQILSKLAAADYLGISRATFDNKIHDGLLPKGHKYPNLKELIWFKTEIDSFMLNL